MQSKQDFTLPKRLAKAYERAITGHITRVLPPKTPEQTFDQWIDAIARKSQEYDAQEATEHLAGSMVRWVNSLNSRSWRAAANKATKSRLLHGLLQQEMQGPVGARVHTLVRENAQYISSLPRDAAEQLNREILRASQNGARPETIGRMARKRFPELLRSRINLIARTETAKASAALTQARCNYLNLPCYLWSTSEDARVRQSHRALDNVVVFWDDPPATDPNLGYGHAGEFPNCRCTSIVILSLDDIKFPRRVYRRGAITVMTKPQFKGLLNAA
jgi:SPP1 gp7 family putative phage head morphogenesis protein